MATTSFTQLLSSDKRTNVLSRAHKYHLELIVCVLSHCSSVLLKMASACSGKPIYTLSLKSFPSMQVWENSCTSYCLTQQWMNPRVFS